LSTPAETLRFWYEEAGPENWWRKSDAFDALVLDRFAATHEAAARGDLDHWAETPEGALALVIVLDQFPRNMFRGTPSAFATDGQALAVTEAAVARGDDLSLDEGQRHFLYMPYMHSERLADQERCCALMESRMPGSDAIRHAHEHRDIIRRFGRFPHRNTILGRPSTPEEEHFLADGGFAG
jgi:uncharacterized protein (DUF924 family)